MRIENDAELDRHRGPGRCQWCGQWMTRREPHHLRARGTGGHKQLDIPINLIALGSSALLHPCHRALEDGNGNELRKVRQRGLSSRQQALEIVAKREGTTADDIQAVTDAILRIPKEGRQRDIEREAASLTLEQQQLFWQQLGYVARVLPPSDLSNEPLPF